MKKFKIALLAMLASFITGCATTGESYTDEGIGSASTAEVKASANSNLPEASEVLPEIAAYDEPDIPALYTLADHSDLAISDSPETTALPEIDAYDDPEIPALDALATE